MKSNVNGKNRKLMRNNSLGMMSIVFVTMIVLVVFSIKSRGLAEKLTYYESRKVALERAVVSEQQRTEEIDALREYMQTDAYAEQLAREKLGLVKDNEIVFIEEN